jgi:FMN reductase
MMRLAFEDGRVKVVGIGGTLREGSTSLGTLPQALAASGDAGAEVEKLDLDELELPMYEPRKPLHEYGDNVRHLVGAIREADALLISTAAYHGTLAEVTKNALDYAQFLGKEEHPYIEGKVVGLISTAGGEQAATNANAAMVHALRGIVAPLMVGITKVWQHTADNGDITDDRYGRRLENLGRLVMELAEKFQEETPSRRWEPVGAVA